VIEYRYAHGKLELLPALAAEVVRLKVDLILTSGDFAIRAAKEASPTIPIVVALAGEIVAPVKFSGQVARGGTTRAVEVPHVGEFHHEYLQRAA
jgi:putative tryptophan/tyrosine transport system substrate-binding protein